MNENMDLNIDNYGLNDLLTLFKLDYNFNTDDLKQAKRILLKTHPDKSNLNKKFFLFFTKAYKIIYTIHQFRSQSNRSQSTVYSIEKDEDREAFIQSIAKKPNFNKAFNEFFENTYIRSDYIETGYGDWLKSDEDLNNTKISNMTQMNETFEKKKNEIRALVEHKEIEETGGDGHYDLLGNAPESYSSSMFSNLQYEDLKKAHVESVVPVSRKDYEEKQRFANSNDLKSFRDADDATPISLNQASTYLKQQKEMENKNSVMRAYELAKQDEVALKMNMEWLTRFKQLTDS